jgi:hypothetical protein
MLQVIEAEAALDAQPSLVGRAVAPLDLHDPVPLHVVGQQAADPAVRADGVDAALGDRGVAAAACIHQAGRHQRAGGAGLHALAATDAGALAHGIVEIEHDLRMRPAPGQADDVVDLHLAAGPHA